MLKKLFLAILLALPLLNIQPPKPVAQDPYPGCYPCSEPTKPGSSIA